ncbi:hypothetical protein Btru_005338 [Bulinus truncatus]|nr:hypothetical protein Btru_005338 [Bulinus truncatus]
MSNPCLPFYAEGTVVSGFGRGSKELGIPTANFPENIVKNLPDDFKCGVYYGWAKISSNDNVFKMTMSVGWNPYYHNTVKTMETHILHKFEEDFYGDHLKLIVLGYLRDMLNFKSVNDLILAIKNDIVESDQLLDEPYFKKYKDDLYFKQPLQLKSQAEGTDISAEMVDTYSLSKILDENNSQSLPCSETNGHDLCCQPLDLKKVISDSMINGSLEGYENKEMCISNLKLKNSLCCEDKLDCKFDTKVVQRSHSKPSV